MQKISLNVTKKFFDRRINNVYNCIVLVIIVVIVSTKNSDLKEQNNALKKEIQKLKDIIKKLEISKITFSESYQESKTNSIVEDKILSKETIEKNKLFEIIKEYSNK